MGEYIDVMDICDKWGRIEEFSDVGLGGMKKEGGVKAKVKLYEEMLDNA
nr:hypothetical protein [Staphylococcus pettenkoferi]